MYFDVDIDKMNKKIIENIKLAHDVTEDTPAIEVGFYVEDPCMTLGEYMDSNFDYTKIAPGIFVTHSWGLYMGFDLHLVASYGYGLDDFHYDTAGLPIPADPNRDLEAIEFEKNERVFYANGLSSFGYCAHVNDFLMRYGNALEEWEKPVIVTFKRLSEKPEKPWKNGPHIDKYLVEDYEEAEYSYNYDYNYGYHIYVIEGDLNNEVSKMQQ